MKFSIEQLITANALMFPHDFEMLFKKHAPKDYPASSYVTAYRKYNSNLLLFISEYCRHQDSLTKIIEKMIADILKLEYVE